MFYQTYCELLSTQASKYWVCDRCQREGKNRLETAKRGGEAAEKIKRAPMKFSSDNTSLEFRSSGQDPLMDLTIVEESLICLVSAVVSIQRLETREGMFPTANWHVTFIT